MHIYIQRGNLCLFLLLGTLASCGDIHNLPITNNTDPHIEENLPINNEETTVQINNKYLPILELVERIRIFTEETQTSEAHKVSIANDQFEVTSGWKKAYEQNKLEKSEWINRWYEKTENLMTGNQTINNYLAELLGFRLDYLNTRSSLIEDNLDRHRSRDDQVKYYPTSKFLFDFATELQDESCKNFNEAIRLNTIHKYELITLLIRQAFNCCSLEELEPSTIDLLRASAQLRLILSNERLYDLGHPDLAIPSCALLELFVQYQKGDKKLLRDYPKIKKAVTQVFEADSKLPDKSNTAVLMALKSVVLGEIMEPFKLKDESEIEEKLKGENSLIIEGLVLMGTLGLDLSIYSFHLKQQDFYIRYRNLGCSPKLYPVKSTYYQMGVWPHELPDPDFLKIKPLELTIQPSLWNNKDADLLLVSNEQKDKQKTEDATWRENEILTPKQSNIVSSPGQLLVEEPNYTRQADREASKPFGVETVDMLPVNKEEVEDHDSSIVWLLPQGIRSFHCNMPFPSGVSVVQLKEHQYIVDALFHHKQQQTVTYKEFKNAWEELGGQIIENHDGSHKQLIASNGKELWGIFAHGKNQVYGKGYCKYLQTALLYAGAGPSDWFGKEIIFSL